MTTCALDVHQDRATAAAAPIGAEVRHLGSCAHTSVSRRIISGDDSAIRDVLDVCEMHCESELDPIRGVYLLQLLKISTKADLSASIRNRRGPLSTAINT